MFKGGGVAKTGCSDVQVYKMKLHDLHFSTDIIRKIKSKIMRLVGYVARMGGGDRNAYSVLVAKPEGKRLLER